MARHSITPILSTKNIGVRQKAYFDTKYDTFTTKMKNKENELPKTWTKYLCYDKTD